ncbi:pilus assembly PilX family protein [Cellvibrio sp. NN19]|uniref:pilus assembly PilX family protein n=1 Tax=Cellvibrio chitinivorans TaxID=3102792 RepID=UPI002B40EBD7|nr:PilX N-terminal domain-containing pilus assembly protein [Cellvibrio sp. NN19]
MKSQFIEIKQQTGAVLVVGLVLLLILTVIGLASIRGSDLQERMAGNMRDRNIAFQASEAALREGEDLLNLPVLPSFSGSVVGYWPDLNKPGAIRPRPTAWTAQQWGANSVQLDADTIGETVEQPRYAIEKVIVTGLAASQGSGVDKESIERAQDAEYYRITSRGLGITSDAEVVLQSTFAR